ncbi:hypothetical protein Tsubulata_009730 [Turnera subulata]|uniref:HMA domain-containing protein n=1 Tax=Turnera subulata TaxID=218843 RepID=A0A9Q0FPG8_9ROSI|nr:hypothetical protein Tsubulata_009730 [Turnera subulata]
MGKGNNKQQNQVEGENDVEENGKADNDNEGKKEEKKNGGGQKNAVLKVLVHCKGCSDQIYECLRGFDGVEEILIDDANNKVTVKGKNVDPMKVLARLQRKYSRNVELLHPKPKPNNDENNEPKKEKPPQMKTIVLKMNFHCEGCAQDIKKAIGSMTGIMHVEPDIKKSLVTVKGVFDPQKIVKKIADRVGRHVQVVKQQSEEKEKEGKKKNGSENTVSYPPDYHVKYVYPSLVLSDENVFSCAIM